MPACTTESIAKLWGPDPESINASLENSEAGSTPSSPLSTSPTGTFRRSRSANSASSDFFQEHFTIKSDWREGKCVRKQTQSTSFLAKIIGWYPCFLLQVLTAAITVFLPMSYIRSLLAIPSMWVTLWVWIIIKLLDIPLTIFKWTLTIICIPSLDLFQKKRTVLISGGSTIQALHMARNFYSAGARVIVCEIDGLFALTKFSTAVSKSYTLPKPDKENPRTYIKALCEIVEKERVSYYIPINASSSAYFDGQAKPALELMGCTCICPDSKQALLFDDILNVFQKCIDNNIPTPAYYPITSNSKLIKLYQNGTMRHGRYVMNSCGVSGSIDRTKQILPRSSNDLKFNGEISEAKPWVVVEDQPGQHFVTCTAVKNSQVIANVTCKLDENKCLQPVEHKDIDQWLQIFFSKLNLVKPVSGHFTFRFVITKRTNTILPLNCKVGVSLPYICYTSVHPKVIWKHCRHFNRQSSGPLVTNKGRYWMHHLLLNAVQKPSVESVTKLIDTVLDKREMLFLMWDPLPYWAYYHIQLPYKNITGFLRRRKFSNAMTTPV